jgi:sialic acid synthase SpsE
MSIEIIAELAQGFEGRPEQAHLLLKAAAASGADAAKYQLVYADELATPDYKYYELFRSLEMPDSDWNQLAILANELGIGLQLDVFGKRSLALAESLKVSAVKLHGTDIANVGLLQAVADTSIKRVLLGAGGAHASELDQALNLLEGKEITILLGFQGYPTPNGSNQIDRVRYMREKYRQNPRVSIGFADHALPDSPLCYALASVAVGAGAAVIEKHLTLGKVMKLEDHESALNPDEFLEFTQTLRDCAQALGVPSEEEDFGMSESEQNYRNMIRRHVVANRDLKAGDSVTPSDCVLKRTSAEQAITDLPFVYQKTMKREVKINAPVLPGDLE